MCTISAISAAGAAPPGGETLFGQRCQACHTTDAEQPVHVGPNLSGVLGRKAASTAFDYSLALGQSGLNWTKQTLDKFLAAPTNTVLATRMVIAVPDAGQRKALVDYLATLR